MITLDRTNKEAGLRVVEKPNEIFPRLRHLEPDDGALIEQLTRLGIKPLQRLSKLSQRALARLGGNKGGNGRPHVDHAPRVIARSRSFGD